jgi:hypothetical protein
MLQYLLLRSDPMLRQALPLLPGQVHTWYIQCAADVFLSFYLSRKVLITSNHNKLLMLVSAIMYSLTFACFLSAYVLLLFDVKSAQHAR